MSSIAHVIVELSLDREFDYSIPAHLKGSVQLGSRVNVPFGRSVARGYVVGFAESSAWPDLKSIDSLVDDRPYIDESLLKLARWIGQYYCAPIESAVKSVLPGAVRRAAARFQKRKYVSPNEYDIADFAALKSRSPRQAEVLELLQNEGGRFLQELISITGASTSVIKGLAEKGFITIEEKSVSRDPSEGKHYLPTEPLELMDEQAKALEMIKRSLDGDAKPVILLHGVTGSGKTEVYLQAIHHALGQGKGAIVLVPEISLTPQTIERFKSRFGDCVAVLHSHLSEGERHDEWHRIHQGQVQIVVGARSAVFAPVRNLGLLVVDEEHEPSYKQEEMPRYNARDVAVMRGHIEGCSVVLGSATPSLESYVNARKGKYDYAVLAKRVDDRALPVMRIIDMRLERSRENKGGIFSGDLVEAINKRLERGEQTILFLNRRGFSSSLICEHCGHVSTCSQCSMAFTYHRREELLKCHLCGQSKQPPERCVNPECAQPAFKFKGVGTQKVESVARALFPAARIQRIDADVTMRKDAYEEILGDFRSGKTDILLGTQMIAKGLHFPNVTLIGVMNADLSLHIADFRAGERTFQLLTQVAGRAGRGDVPGEVLVQTFSPFHQAIQAARRLDFDSFADQEQEFRRELLYPPFAHLVCLTIRGKKDQATSQAAEFFASELFPMLNKQVMAAGPVPAPIARVKGYYRYQILLRCPSAKAMTEPVKALGREFKWPRGISCSVDVDALSMS